MIYPCHSTVCLKIVNGNIEELELAALQSTAIRTENTGFECESLLYRLISLCIDTFTLCSPQSAHTARAYIGLLSEVARVVSTGPSCVIESAQVQLNDPNSIQTLFEPNLGQFWDQFAGVDALRDLNYNLPLTWPSDWMSNGI